MHNYVTGSRLITLVDTNGNPTGSADIFEAHRYPTQLHTAASVWIFKDDQVLLQQRSAKKILAADWWANTVCGNVKPDESPLECAYRRLEGELNFSKDFVTIKPSYTFTYKAYGNEQFSEHEFDHVFVGSLNDTTAPLPQPNPDEAQAIAWVSFSELKKWALSLDYPSLAESLKLSDQELQAKTKPQVFTFERNEYLIAPWTIFMLRDERL